MGGPLLAGGQSRGRRRRIFRRAASRRFGCGCGSPSRGRIFRRVACVGSVCRARFLLCEKQEIQTGVFRVRTAVPPVTRCRSARWPARAPILAAVVANHETLRLRPGSGRTVRRAGRPFAVCDRECAGCAGLCGRVARSVRPAVGAVAVAVQRSAVPVLRSAGQDGRLVVSVQLVIRAGSAACLAVRPWCGE